MNSEQLAAIGRERLRKYQQQQQRKQLASSVSPLPRTSIDSAGTGPPMPPIPANDGSYSVTTSHDASSQSVSSFQNEGGEGSSAAVAVSGSAAQGEGDADFNFIELETSSDGERERLMEQLQRAEARAEEALNDRDEMKIQLLESEVAFRAEVDERSQMLERMRRENAALKLESIEHAQKRREAEDRAALLLAENRKSIALLEELRAAQIVLSNEKAELIDELHSAKRTVDSLTEQVEALRATSINSKGDQNLETCQIEPSATDDPRSVRVTTENVGADGHEDGVDNTHKSQFETSNTADTHDSLHLARQVAELSHELERARMALKEERHRTELLAMELECLPDYIHLYHKERKLLLARAANVPNSQDKMESSVTVDDLLPVSKPPREVPIVSLLGSVGTGLLVECCPCADCSGNVIFL
ncbi:hypothetical protein HDU83_004508 [Entophlyctis luteolus]|nr:hypothetical protein HDU83_004508 [Entophlyctis luteolus]